MQHNFFFAESLVDSRYNYKNIRPFSRFRKSLCVWALGRCREKMLQLAGLHDHFNRGRFSIEARFQLIFFRIYALDRKRIYANPSSYPNLNSNPNINPNPKPKAQLCFRIDEITSFFDQVFRYLFFFFPQPIRAF